MGNWKLGYPAGLDDDEIVSSEDDGRNLYNSYGVIPITLSDTKMCRAVGQVSGNPTYNGSTTTINCINLHVYPSKNDTDPPGNENFADNEFNNGFIRFLSGKAAGYKKNTENKAFKVIDTIYSEESNELIFNGDITDEEIANGDYFEVLTGASTYIFPSHRNPIRRDFKRIVNLGKSLRFPIYDKGLLIPQGYDTDDFVIMAYFTSEKEIDRLQVMLSHTLTYKGFDYIYSYELGDIDYGAAPMILETGSNDIRNQYLVGVSDWKIVKDAKRSDNFWEVMIHFVSYWKTTHRGI